MKYELFSADLGGVYKDKDHVAIVVEWSADIGFGEIIIKQYANDDIVMDTELMGKDFVRDVLHKFVDDAVERAEIE